jgi:two-component system phosphate regulon sensor histidine kinase PhoR
MASKLRERIETVLSQANEQEAVFSSMVEGLLAVDTDERIIRMNRAAAAFFDVDPDEARGRTIQEVIRNPELQKFVTRALTSREPVEGDIILRVNGGERFLQAHGALLLDAESSRRGLVVVLNDVTRLRQLEAVRRDFVANVSHELRTPITSIKGFVETLRDGAIHNREDAEHFLGIIAKQSDRMNSIIADLLTLSRVEQDMEKEKVRFETGRLTEALREAVQVCERKASEKEISIGIECPQDLTARINAALIEQAVVNLIDNAVKNSDPGTRVTVSAGRSDGGTVISVADEGYGIPAKHIPRLFERFYRVDKARSSKLGGTGLGLAIVKHIAQAHGGSVSVESTPGSGSKFTIFLPDES